MWDDAIIVFSQVRKLWYREVCNPPEDHIIRMWLSQVNLVRLTPGTIIEFYCLYPFVRYLFSAVISVCIYILYVKNIYVWVYTDIYIHMQNLEAAAFIFF